MPISSCVVSDSLIYGQNRTEAAKAIAQSKPLSSASSAELAYPQLGGKEKGWKRSVGTLTGGVNKDFPHGHEGGDAFVGNDGGEELFGGSGFDIISYAGEDGKQGGVGFRVHREQGKTNYVDNNGVQHLQDNLTSIEDVFGSSYNDNIYGNDENNILYGNRGYDVLEGGGDDDLLSGGTGLDYLYGDEGTDTANYSLTATTTPMAIHPAFDSTLISEECFGAERVRYLKINCTRLRT